MLAANGAAVRTVAFVVSVLATIGPDISFGICVRIDVGRRHWYCGGAVRVIVVVVVIAVVAIDDDDDRFVTGPVDVVSGGGGICLVNVIDNDGV